MVQSALCVPSGTPSSKSCLSRFRTMSVQESKSAADLFADDAAAHQYIQSRAKHLIDFLQIDDEAFYKKLPHLEHAEPYNFEGHRNWVAKTPISHTLDHTLLRPEATQAQFDKLCEEAKSHDLQYICLPGDRLEKAVELLHGSNVKVACVMGFPHGNGHSRAKQSEATLLLGLGAAELDMVLDVGKMKEKNYHDVQRDIRLVSEQAALRDASRVVKVILETCLLTADEIIDACMLSVLAGAHFVKTSTGFSTGGATKEVVHLMKLVVADTALVKASGGVKTSEDAKIMLQHGASRIGTSSGVSIATAP